MRHMKKLWQQWKLGRPFEFTSITECVVLPTVSLVWLGAAFDSPETIGELIADGHHVVLKLVRFLSSKRHLKELPLLRTVCQREDVLTATICWGELPVIVENGTACLKEGGNLAGSILQLKDGVKHVVDWGLVTVAQALQMATSVPAKSVGLENTCGSLKAGLPADFIVLDDSLGLTSNLC